ncbi:MAG: hypothetical protein M4579_000466 [Chaenotheca gracillima]|nr:MAG: hypothetical protein M4579_000466 [Chaenotheca gracillima]
MDVQPLYFQEITCFSYDDEHKLHLDESSLRYYYPPKLGANLSDGFETFQKLNETADEHLDSLLATILALEKETGVACEADVITWRGMMTKGLNATPFSFIEENHEYKLSSQEAQHNQPPPRRDGPSQDMMSYWGYKFETLSLIPQPWAATSRDYIESREDEIVNNKAQYCSIVKTGIGKAKMILGGEVDAVWDCKPANPLDPIDWVELKTSEDPLLDYGPNSRDRAAVKFERKLLKFWIQSFLLGVPRIIVGMRDRNGILQRVEELETEKIPGDVKRKGKASWDGKVCISFTASFLEWLKQTIPGQAEGADGVRRDGGVWRVYRSDKSNTIEVVKLEESGYGDILPPDFVKWREELAGGLTAEEKTG